MFGGAFGPFRSKDRHCFVETSAVYQQVAELAIVREKELALRRGRQYLREVSGDGFTFGYPQKLGEGRMTGVIAWSRIFDGVEIVCAINTDVDGERSVWINVDSIIHGEGHQLKQIFPQHSGKYLQVVMINRRAAVRPRVPAGGFVMFK